MSKVKVLLATYNGEKFIKEQIKSILDQNEVEVDIVIRDDNSQDQTLKIVREEFPLLKIDVNNPGSGSAARNFLNMLISLDFTEDFDYISFADQDDIWLPTKLERAIEQLTEHSASLYCSNLIKWDMSTDSFSLLKKDYKQENFDFLFEGGSAGCTYVFTKAFGLELQKKLSSGEWITWRRLSHDWLVYFYARILKLPVIIDEKSLIHYRLHGNNVHGHLNQLSFKSVKEKVSQVLQGYHKEVAENFITQIPVDSIEYDIYKKFLGSYWQRNIMIWRYNTKLMRDKKKLLVFIILNLVKIN